ncbi:response regulator [Alteromonas oceanisediminis]|uniref:response regulator n=1 Tax=Alteromonas oceanisediminis TaxID=2836180 RepID=UPI001BDB5639|nr:response regulator [Alteromonas oceanisediminis]MBT0587648.1 response regulator [Alteromonas oceanisediminis]
MNIKLARQSKVLIIDDQALAKGYMKYSLEELGFDNIHYSDVVSHAMQTVRREHFDLIICSYDLKNEQDGYYLYDQLKADGDIAPSTAFVFISADTTPDIVHSIVELQPDDFLAKPFTVRELDTRLSRVLMRKKALKPIYELMERDKPEKALVALENFLSEPSNSEFFPLALRTKGELLERCGFHQQGSEFYSAILNVQAFAWAQLGLVRCLIKLDRDDDAEKLILSLAFKPDCKLAAYDLLAALQIKQHEFDDALESVVVATEVSPRNIRRHKTALDLSRIVHDYAAQFDAAKRIVKFAKNSIHDKPENYLTVARAGIDFAMTADETQTHKLIKQTTEYLRQLKSSFPKADIEDQVKVINARLMYLEDETENAKALLSQLSNDSWDSEPIEGLLDKAKAFHEVGLHEHSLHMLDAIEIRCRKNAEQGDLFMHYVEKEKIEKTAIQTSPKELNNQAVKHYEKGEIEQALTVFRQAFTVMPKNPSIALNLLQATAAEIKEFGVTANAPKLIKNCILTIENGTLNADQEQRYHNVRSFLKDVV